MVEPIAGRKRKTLTPLEMIGEEDERVWKQKERPIEEKGEQEDETWEE